MSAEKSHDVYDSFILAFARAYDADYVITTDRDFDFRYEGEAVRYVNPIRGGKPDELASSRGDLL